MLFRKIRRFRICTCHAFRQVGRRPPCHVRGAIQFIVGCLTAEPRMRSSGSSGRHDGGGGGADRLLACLESAPRRRTCGHITGLAHDRRTVATAPRWRHVEPSARNLERLHHEGEFAEALCASSSSWVLQQWSGPTSATGAPKRYCGRGWANRRQLSRRAASNPCGKPERGARRCPGRISRSARCPCRRACPSRCG